MLKVNDINVYYGAIHAIKGVSFEVNEGEVVTLIGANGAGKSTILNTVSGLLHSKTGSIEFLGKSLAGVPAHKIVSQGLAHVPEGRRIFLQMTVEENLEMGAYTQPGSTVDPGIARVYEQFPRLKERRKQIAGTLSGANGTFGGQLVAATGDFKGVVQAEDFLDRYGNSMMNGTKFASDYLDLYGITITNRSTGEITFAVSSTGRITINGQITMGAGSTINWANISNTNLAYNPAYSMANDAYNLADDAMWEAELAYDRADRAYTLANSIELPRYIKSTYIDSTTIRSPVIEGGEFYGEEFNVIAGSDFGSFNLYGPYGSSRYHMLAIEYFEGDAPYVNIYSPCGAYIEFGDRYGVIYFNGEIDFSNANVRGLDLGTGG